MVGLGGFEPPTSPLSGVRSNQLSYRPQLRACMSLNVTYKMPVSRPLRKYIIKMTCVDTRVRCISLKGGDPAPGSPRATLLRLHPSHESLRGDRPPEG